MEESERYTETINTLRGELAHAQARVFHLEETVDAKDNEIADLTVAEAGLSVKLAETAALLASTQSDHGDCHERFQWESDQLKSLVATHRKSFNNVAADLANSQADVKAASRKRRRD